MRIQRRLIGKFTTDKGHNRWKYRLNHSHELWVTEMADHIRLTHVKVTREATLSDYLRETEKSFFVQTMDEANAYVSDMNLMEDRKHNRRAA